MRLRETVIAHLNWLHGQLQQLMDVVSKQVFFCRQSRHGFPPPPSTLLLPSVSERASSDLVTWPTSSVSWAESAGRQPVAHLVPSAGVWRRECGEFWQWN
ncbi:hypothetical protein BaRGS_00013427 [Batillaria attramentaria]|uniref:Uncharacterized protein n=1 Tax=Batillaria attramentaria TaxID=370345 RepID=A0ABD0L7D2_9CAEN